MKNDAQARAVFAQDDDSAQPQPLSGVTRLAAVGTALLLIMFLVLTTTRAAFTSTTSTPANAVSSGDVLLSDDDAGVAMFSATNLGPLSTVVRCIHVDYTGSLDPLAVRVYATGLTGSLAAYLDTTIEMGADTTDAFGSCTNFVPDSTLFTGTLASFAAAHSSWSTGLSTWDPAAASARTFRITITVQDIAAAAGASAGWGFSWETRSA